MNAYEKLTDNEIAKRVPDDPEAFAVVVRRYEAALLRYVRRLGVGKVEDREDIVQEAFLKAYKGIRGFDTKLSLSAWLYRITHNETVSFFRAKKVRPEGNLEAEGEEALLHIIDESSDVLKDSERSFNARAIHEALIALDQTHREVLVLRYFEHKTYDEISDILRIPEGTVATLIHRAKKALGQKVSHLEERI